VLGQTDGTASAAESQISCSHTIVREWDLSLPALQLFAVSGTIPIAHSNGNGFAVEMDGTALLVDTDGDGKAELRVSPPESVVVLRGKDVHGNAFRASIFLKEGPSGWSWRAAGVMRGEFQGTRIRFIDQNGDGHYNGVGEDAIIIGNGKVASFLGEAVNIGGELFEIQVAPSGQSATLSPYSGAAGTLDMVKGFQSKAPLWSAVVQSVDRRQSFNMSDARSGMMVPVGKYVLHNGEVRLGGNRVQVQRGHSRPIEVAQDERTEWAFGGAPLRAEFQYQRGSGALAFNPNAISYFGTAGEEYVGWAPLGESPVFIIADRKTGAELARTQFPASC
jgi:hypothetical protein